jgi:hypothetical protein
MFIFKFQQDNADMQKTISFLEIKVTHNIRELFFQIILELRSEVLVILAVTVHYRK